VPGRPLRIDFLREWGDNGFGQLGDGTEQARSAPNIVHGGFGGGLNGLALGAFHAVCTDGTTVWARGANADGQVGNGQRSSSQLVPTKVVGIVDPDPNGDLQ